MKWALGFFAERSPQSMTRLCAFLCCVAGCYVGVRHPDKSLTVTALIGGGAVALLSRQKKSSGGDGQPSAPSEAKG